MKMDETLYSIQEKIQNFAVIYLVDIVKVPDFNKVRLSFPLSFDTLYPNLESLSRGAASKRAKMLTRFCPCSCVNLKDVRAYVPHELSSRELSLTEPAPSLAPPQCTILVRSCSSTVTSTS